MLPVLRCHAQAGGVTEQVLMGRVNCSRWENTANSADSRGVILISHSTALYQNISFILITFLRRGYGGNFLIKSSPCDKQFCGMSHKMNCIM